MAKIQTLQNALAQKADAESAPIPAIGKQVFKTYKYFTGGDHKVLRDNLRRVVLSKAGRN